jgi:type VI secretion system secreted protein Hcp
MAQQDIFLKLPGIDGESKDPEHPSEIQLSSFALSGSFHLTTESVVGTSGGTGKVSFADMSCVKSVDKAHPNLFKAMWTRQLIPKATLVVRKAGKKQMEYLKYELEDVYVSSVSVGGAAAAEGVVPAESFSLSFAKVTIEYKEQNADGTLAGSVKCRYDLKTAK